ncbi:MAG: ATP-binding protein [Pyrinomonadaceae bacterium]
MSKNSAMEEDSKKRILAQVAAKDFVGRAREIEMLRQHTDGETAARGMLLLSAPAAGASELLRQTYDRIFNEQKVIPFYFAFRQTDATIKDCAVRFLQTFLQQTVAFRRDDAGLLTISPDVCEINELASPPEVHWIHQLTTACRKDSELNDEQSFVRQALSAPFRAAANDAPVVVLLDDLQNAPAGLIEVLKEIYIYATVPFVLAGKRRFVLNAINRSGAVTLYNDIEILRLENLPAADAEILTEKLAKNLGVKINEQTRDLLVRQLSANPLFIEAILAAAAKRGKDLENFQTVEQIYTDELFGGRIGKFYENMFSESSPNAETPPQIIKLLHDGFSAENGQIPADVWRENLALKDRDFNRLLNNLHTREIINFNSGTIYFSVENEILKDYTKIRYRLEILCEPRALAVSEMLKNSLERAPQLLARVYRRAAAIGLRELLSVFNCQSVPANLLDYEKFKNDNKETANDSETSLVKLPQTVFTASGAAFYPPVLQVADEDRIAVASGFKTADYRQENEIVWIAAEVDSKLEAAKELTEFWCDRLEMIALTCNFSKYQLWLVAPEGFTPEAVEVLRRRNAFGASRRQVELLIEYLGVENIVRKKTAGSEYELILPMGEDTELIAAGAVEEIARRHHFAPPDITKIKTALVEAYINATEHSLSPDRKIYQKFLIEDDKIVITISNRGLKLPPDKVAESSTPIEPESGRRGWGLKLMRSLMDEVEFEQVDDGTRISMVKYLR